MMRPLSVLPWLAALAAGCFACPTAPTPVASWMDFEVETEPGLTVFGSVYIPEGSDPGWVCSCSCDAAWATVYPSHPDTPETPLSTPLRIDGGDPTLNPDEVRSLVLDIDPNASGGTMCDVVLSSWKTWTVSVEVQ